MAELNAAEADAARLSCAAVEHMICEIWSDYFGREVSPGDDFFDLGGDSLGMIDVVGRARARGLPVRSSVALRNPSPARLAESLTEPLYVVHAAQAELDAVSAWGSPRPVTAFTLPGDPGPAGEIAEELLATARPAGAYRLAGFGPGAVVAFELARRLRDRGDRVALLALVAPPAVETFPVAYGGPAVLFQDATDSPWGRAITDLEIHPLDRLTAVMRKALEA